MSNIKPHQRIFALVTALIFLATSVATGAIVIWQIREDSKGNTATTQPASTIDSTAVTCSIGPAPNQQVLAAPNVTKADTDVTALQKVDTEQGTGVEVKSGDCLTVKYFGALAATGEKFEENFTDTNGLKFQVGTGNVIKGWDQGLIGMKVGGTRQLTIPSDLAYGEGGSGSIPANSDLIFVVKLLEITK